MDIIRKLISSLLLSGAIIIGLWNPLYAWYGEPSFGPINRETIVREATRMVNLHWRPGGTIYNKGGSCTFSSSSDHKGIPYTNYNLPWQDTWDEFYDSVVSSVGYTEWGNDCSGFVSIAWKLPEKYRSNDFICDALKYTDATPCNGNYQPGEDRVETLGLYGEAEFADLRPGDALVAWGSPGHTVIFEGYKYNVYGKKVGAYIYEQTGCSARRNEKFWSQLSDYMPVRRKKVYDYVHTTTWGSSGSLPGEFDFPVDIAVDSQGYVYAVDNGNGRIQKFNNNGSYVSGWDYINDEFGPFWSPMAVAVDRRDNSVFVTDQYWLNYGEIHKFTGSGGHLLSWCYNCTPQALVDDPAGIAIRNDGYIHVADSENDRIKVYSPDGPLSHEWGSFGEFNGQFDYPMDVELNERGQVYVLDSYNDRIQKFESSGNFITKWGQFGAGAGQFNSPGGIAVDNGGNVYVADTFNDRIQKFASTGTFITSWGGYGTGAGQFDYPEGIDVDLSGNVFVADTGNDRIQKFSYVSLTPDSPAAPTGLGGAAPVQGGIFLTWLDNSSNEDWFYIQKKRGPRGPYEYIPLGANAVWYVDKNLPRSDTYYYAVYGYNYRDGWQGRSRIEKEIAVYIDTSPTLGPGNYNFGMVEDGKSSGSVAFVYTKPAGTGIIVTDVYLDGADPAEFSIVSDGCQTQVLSGGMSCVVSMTFNPAGIGDRPATLNITSTDIDKPLKTSTLLGQGAYPPPLASGHPAYTIDNVVVSTSDSVMVDVTNTSGSTFTIASIALNTSTPEVFSLIDTSACDGAVLAPGQSCSVEVGFSPVTEGTNYATLDVNVTAAYTLPLRVPVTGVGVQPRIEVDPDIHHFGEVEVGKSSTPQEFIASNTGSGLLEITGVSITPGSGPDSTADFDIQNDGCTGSVLSETDTCTLRVVLAPLTEGNKNVNLTFSSNDIASPEYDVMLTGSGKIYPPDPPPDIYYTLTIERTGMGRVRSSPPGIDCGSQCSDQFKEDTLIWLDPRPDSGYVFSGWAPGLCDETRGSNECGVRLTMDKTVSAEFLPE